MMLILAEYGHISIVPPYFARPKIKISIEVLINIVGHF